MGCLRGAPCFVDGLECGLSVTDGLHSHNRSSAAVTCGRLIDQRPDLLLNCRQLSTLVTNERPSTALGRPGRALVCEHRIRRSIQNSVRKGRTD